MLIDSITRTIEKSGCVSSFWEKLDNSQDAVFGVVSSARPLFVASRFVARKKPTLVVISGVDAAASFARTLASYIGDDNVFLFPERTDWPLLGNAPDASCVAAQLHALNLLKRGEKCVVVAPASALIRRLAPPSSKLAKPITLSLGCSLETIGEGRFDDLSSFKFFLQEIGYANTSSASEPGTFCSRGGIIDIFPGNSTYPVSLDFFGDEVDEIRRMIPSTGQLVSNIESVDIFPVCTTPLTSKNIRLAKSALEKPILTNKALREVYESLDEEVCLDGIDVIAPYVFKEMSLIGDYIADSVEIALIEPHAAFDDMTNAYERARDAFKDSGFRVGDYFASAKEVNLGKGVRASYSSIMQTGASLDSEVIVKRVDVARSEERLVSRLRTWCDARYLCLFSIPGAKARKDIELSLVDASLPINECLGGGASDDTFSLKRGVVNIVDVDVPLGLVIPSAHLVMLSVDDLKGSRRTSHSSSAIKATEITFPYTAGDYVVHEMYGIAYFKGLVRRSLDGVERDYLELDYAENDKLFLPVEQFEKVTRYVGPEGQTPRITRLDSADWSRALTRARKATRKMAFDLVEVYSRRIAAKGFCFEVDTPWLAEMEQAFPYEETPDQVTAIADIKSDMHSQHPMDRLICGDVGFGKTEIAIRAAFIACQNKKQVMVLCPTTILTQQHAISFKSRLEPFDMRVEALSRFRSPAEQRQVLEGFSKGDVDVLIGTHRLLSRDVAPLDLGLLIIDEEQRFGVQHKEQFKNMREHIDILTLSATPIPRTMQMAVSGVRDMSLILTPPADRLPVKVHVGQWDPDVVSSAIRRELARGGQVYYVSNRVRTIEEASERVMEAAPEAKVGLAHGKMSKDELEHVMEDFAAGLLNVLVATTIIESGIDNPNTNTLIIEDSQRLGLSQMYQLKGRVGRSFLQAYAYFMFPEEVQLTKDARLRLEALSENQGLGSGMRIAMKDLEIRGAGNLLGAEQSGNMSAVGFDLFAQMLNQAVMDVRAGVSSSKPSVLQSAADLNINIPGSFYLSDDYIDDIDERIMWYRKSAAAETISDIDDIEFEMMRLHPNIPDEAQAFFAKERIRIYATDCGVSTISVVAGNLNIEGQPISRDNSIWLKRHGGRCLSDRKKIIIPTKKLSKCFPDALADLPSEIIELLRRLYNDIPDTAIGGKDGL